MTAKRGAWLSFFAWRITAIALAVLISTAVAWSLYGRAIRNPSNRGGATIMAMGDHVEPEYACTWTWYHDEPGLHRLDVSIIRDFPYGPLPQSSHQSEPVVFGLPTWHCSDSALHHVTAAGWPLPMYRYRHEQDRDRGFLQPMDLVVHGGLGPKRFQSERGIERWVLPARPIILGAVVNTVCFAAGIELVLACLGGFKSLRGRWRATHTRCARCAYDLSHTPPGTLCSECGWDPARPFKPLRRARTVALALLLVAGGATIAYELSQLGRIQSLRELGAHMYRVDPAVVQDVARATDRTPDKALFAAIHEDDVHAARRALRRGANPNRQFRTSRILDADRYRFSMTPLAMAAIYGRADLVGLLLDHGADPNLRLEGIDAPPLPLACGWRPPCPSHDAPRDERLRTIDLLLAAGTDLDRLHGWFGRRRQSARERVETSTNPWYTLFGERDPDVALAILDRLGEPDVEPERLVRRALDTCQPQILERYLDAYVAGLGAERDETLYQMLMAACRAPRYRLTMAESILARGADPDGGDSRQRGWLLYFAVIGFGGEERSDHELVQFLFEHGASIDALPEENRATLLRRVVRRDDLDLVRLLLEHGADPTNPPDLLESAWSDEGRAMLRRALEQWDAKQREQPGD
jgi:ribosomal protein L37E